jgi:hypothetical protein
MGSPFHQKPYLKKYSHRIDLGKKRIQKSRIRREDISFCNGVANITG